MASPTDSDGGSLSETKTCDYCGETFERTPHDWDARWAARRYCSRRCSGRANGGRSKLPDTEYRSRYRGWEHQAVAEKKIGRPLRDDEHVHHRNGNTLDNRPENLEVLTDEEHRRRHADARLVYLREKECVICGEEFVPHRTKRARQQTCGDPSCKSALLSLRWQERRAA